MEMYQIISKYLNTVKKILLDDEIPPTFENLKYYFNEDDVLIEIKNNIGIPNTIRLIYLLVLHLFYYQKILSYVSSHQILHNLHHTI